jgi:glycosyltransferase involved in cell wall biosynthesis
MMTTPLISIITVNLNNASGLQKTIESVVPQTFNNYEYVIIDGGSTDGSCNIIEKNAAHINYWVSEEDGGIFSAMNKGILAAKGKYLMFLNSGDYLSVTDILQKVSGYLGKEDIVYGNMYQLVKTMLVETIYPSKITAKYFFVNSIPHPSSFTKKELFEKHGLFSTKYKIISDWEFFFLAVCKHNCTTKHLPFFVSVYNLLGISHTQSASSQKKREREQVYQEHFLAFKKRYEPVLKIEKIVFYPYRLFKRGIRFILRFFNIHRVYIKDLG